MVFFREPSWFWEKYIFSVSAIMQPLDLSLTSFKVSMPFAVSRILSFSACVFFNISSISSILRYLIHQLCTFWQIPNSFSSLHWCQVQSPMELFQNASQVHRDLGCLLVETTNNLTMLFLVSSPFLLKHKNKLTVCNWKYFSFLIRQTELKLHMSSKLSKAW